MTDQQRADHTGFAGNPVVRTPVLDQLAARGTVFDNAWVSNPVCMPNRATIMTGRLPSAHQVTWNGCTLPWGSNTFARALRAAGYRTGLIGKSHLQAGPSRAVSPNRPVADSWPPGWDQWEDDARYIDGIPALGDDFYGFDTVEFALDHGARVSGHHLQWALDRGGHLAELYVAQEPAAPASQRSPHWWQVFQPPYPEELHSTSFVADRTIAFIEDAHADGRPWLAVASFPDPHHPIAPPGRWYERHDPADMEPPDTLDDPLTSGPDFLIRMQQKRVDEMRFWAGVTGATSPDVVKACIAATYGAIEMVDDRVGDILRTTQRLGALDNTIVVFTSDHGDMMGDHGLLLKGLMHYRGAAQVPLVIAAPGKRAARSTSLASSIDLAPTILDLCDVEPYDGLQGTSLVPILDDPSARVRDRVLIEDDVAEPIAALMGLPNRTRSVITETTRYTRYSSNEEQLFDLVEDPDELTCLASTPRRNECVELLLDAVTLAAAGDVPVI